MKRETSLVGLCVLTSVVLLLVFLAMFRVGFEQYSEASAEKISAYTNDARWDERHAVIVMADSVIFLVMGLIFMAIALAVHEKSKDER